MPAEITQKNLYIIDLMRRILSLTGDSSIVEKVLKSKQGSN